MQQYNSAEIASKFDHFKNVFYDKQYKKIDIPSVIKLLNEIDLSNKSVIDYGCGSGFYTRVIAKLAKRVVGVDKSKHMIDLANEINSKDGLNIEYHVQDCAEILNFGQFDLVFSAFFLTFSVNRDMLKGFAQSMFNSLKPKHICCGIMTNYRLKPNEFKYLQKYGTEHIRDENVEDFGVHRAKFYENECDKSEFLYEVRLWYISPETMEQVFKEVGFLNFKWINLTLSDEFSAEADFYKDFLDHPPSIIYYAEKP